MINAKARVSLNLEITLGDVWGGDCQVAQIHKQAAEAAIGSTQSLSDMIRQGRAKVIGEPKVTTILLEEVK